MGKKQGREGRNGSNLREPLQEKIADRKLRSLKPSGSPESRSR